MSQVAVQVVLDQPLVEAAERSGLNIGLETARAIRRKLGLVADPAADEAEIRQSIGAYNDFVDQNGLLSDRWRSF